MSEKIKWEIYSGLSHEEIRSRIKSMGPDQVLDCGWIPPDEREPEVVALTDAIVAAMPKFGIRGRYRAAERRYNLWRFTKERTGSFIQYIWQLTGSCLPAHAPIRMADGTEKPISQIVVGDQVVTHLGRSRQVVGIQKKRTDEQMRKIRAQGWGDRLFCTDGHLLPVWRDETINWTVAKDVLPGDWLLVGYGTVEPSDQTIDVCEWIKGCDLSEISHYRYDGKRNGSDVSPTHRRTSALTKVAKERGLLGKSLVTVNHARLKYAIPRRIPVTCAFARWIGLYLAEGCVSDGRITFTLSAEETHLAAEIVQLTKGIFGLDANIYANPNRQTILSVRVPSLPLSRFIAAFCPGKAMTKRVPGIFFSCHESIQRALIGGWFDGDGYAKQHNKGMRITGVSGSRGLIRDMGQLALSCGVPAFTVKRPARKQSKEAGELGMWPQPAKSIPSNKLASMPCGKVGLKTCSRMTPMGMAYKVMTNEAIGIPEDEVYDIEVAQDRTFLAWGFVVHNCVGAGGANMLMTLMWVEIAMRREAEEFKKLWWLFTYGRSRFHSGIRGRGEGSTGAGWAKAITEDGIFEHDPEGYPDLPDFKVVDGWLQIPSGIEMEWSDGGRINQQWFKLGKENLVKTASRIRSADEGIEALINGYPLTQASNFGFRSSKVRGNPAVRIAPWDGSWSHQTYIDEYWDHPTEGELVRWGNNWGPDAHGAPTGDEPPGGVYITKATFDKICRNGEVYAFSAFDGFPAREINWDAYL